ncbi:MAG: FKBP-type peptidyl-prolyl cis-trans isomerase [Balneola sp.]
MKILFFSLAILIFTNGCDRNSGCNIDINLTADQQKLDSDIQEIDNFLSENNIEAQTHPTGLRYIINDFGSGANPEICDIITFDYVGRALSDSTIVEQSDASVRFGLFRLIEGFKIGIPLIKEGGSITLFIPSEYGYEEGGPGGTPSTTNLIFDVDLINIE